MAKTLEPGSRFAKFDVDGDGVVTDEEMEQSTAMLELELREEKSDAQRRMAWIAMASMILFTIGLFAPIFTDSRINAVADILGLFYIAQAGVVGAYMGVSSGMSKK